jgi:membrane fusion protein, adhesin transport system
VTNELIAQNRMTSVSADLLELPSSLSRLLIYSITATVLVFTVWSMITPVLEVASATGVIVPENHVQTVQSLDGGAVETIYAKAGDHLMKGDLFLKLDPTASHAAREEVLQQLQGLEVSAIRLQALLAATPLMFPSSLARQQQELVAQSQQQFEAAKLEQENMLEGFESQIEQRKMELGETRMRVKIASRAKHLAEEELAAYRKLARVRAAGRSEVLNSEIRANEAKGLEQQLLQSLPRIENSIVELQSQKGERLNANRNRIASELSETQTKVLSLKSTLGAQQKRLEQTELRSPISGVLKTVRATSVGQVVRAGDVVAEIVPDNEPFLLEVKIRPEDIAFLRVGMTAIVKLSAYDSSIFGTLNGQLSRLGADSTTDERGQTYFVADVRLTQSVIERLGEAWPIKSGMTANVEIVTGSKSVFQYLTKPIHRMTGSALRER